MNFLHTDPATLHEAARLTARRWGSSVSFILYANKTTIEVVSTLSGSAREHEIVLYYKEMLATVIKMEMETPDEPTI